MYCTVQLNLESTLTPLKTTPFEIKVNKFTVVWLAVGIMSHFIGEHPALIIPIQVDILTLREQNQN